MTWNQLESTKRSSKESSNSQHFWVFVLRISFESCLTLMWDIVWVWPTYIFGKAEWRIDQGSQVVQRCRLGGRIRAKDTCSLGTLSPQRNWHLLVRQDSWDSSQPKRSYKLGPTKVICWFLSWVILFLLSFLTQSIILLDSTDEICTIFYNNNSVMGSICANSFEKEEGTETIDTYKNSVQV